MRLGVVSVLPNDLTVTTYVGKEKRRQHYPSRLQLHGFFVLYKVGIGIKIWYRILFLCVKKFLFFFTGLL